MMRALPARENAHSCRSDTMSAMRKYLAKIRGQFGRPVGDAAAAATKILQSVISFVRASVGAANGNVCALFYPL